MRPLCFGHLVFIPYDDGLYVHGLVPLRNAYVEEVQQQARDNLQTPRGVPAAGTTASLG
jgi:hypothetical protein